MAVPTFLYIWIAFHWFLCYPNGLIPDSPNGIYERKGNYQFNLYNLLGYHNFGLIEPSRAYACVKAALS